MSGPLVAGNTSIDAALEGDQYRAVAGMPAGEASLGFQNMIVEMNNSGLDINAKLPAGTSAQFNCCSAGADMLKTTADFNNDLTQEMQYKPVTLG